MKYTKQRKFSELFRSISLRDWQGTVCKGIMYTGNISRLLLSFVLVLMQLVASAAYAISDDFNDVHRDVMHSLTVEHHHADITEIHLGQHGYDQSDEHDHLHDHHPQCLALELSCALATDYSASFADSGPSSAFGIDRRAHYRPPRQNPATF